MSRSLTNPAVHEFAANSRFGSSVPVAANVGYRAAKWADEGQLRVIISGLRTRRSRQHTTLGGGGRYLMSAKRMKEYGIAAAKSGSTSLLNWLDEAILTNA